MKSTMSDIEPYSIDTSGLDFDPARGHATIRFSFAQAPERISEGIERIAQFIETGSGQG